LECGVNRLDWGPDGHLYIGGIGAGGNWAWNGTRFGLQRMSYNGNDVFEIFNVRATPDGFHVRFTKPIDPAFLEDAENYFLEQWSYQPTADYGGWKKNIELLRASVATAESDGMGVRLTVPGLKAERCVYLRTNPTSVDSDAIWSTEAFYTLNAMPTAEPAAQATLNGEPVLDADVSLGVGAHPPADAVALIGRSHEGMMRHTKAQPKGMPNQATLTQDELLAKDPQQGVAVSPELGDLRTATEFGDHRLHVEWFAPGRADGGYTEQTGNSGVYLQGRYEIQVLGTPAGKSLEPWEAGSIYKFKTPDVNASTGPGTWQAYDIWFRAARFDEQGTKTENARVTVYWNGTLVHDDVELPSPTGMAAAGGEPVRPGDELLNGVLRLQAHGSDADSLNRYRNVWVQPLDVPTYEPGAVVDMFDGDTLDGWFVRGGRGEFDVVDGIIVGTGVANAGGNTFFVTEQTYADFELSYDVLVPHGRMNSGVQIRSHVVGGIDQRDGRVRGYQVEADHTDRGYSGGIFDEQRRGWLAPLVDKPYARRAWRPGRWNTVIVRCRGPLIETWVNGIPAARVLDARTAEGHIALQVHSIGGDESRPKVRFRNIKLRTLTAVDSESD
ncbi:MAG: DUF1080 domain-containing protein, partial [Planctomycetota bacterium]